MATREQAIKAVRDYTGDAARAVELVADPQFDGVWAAQDAQGSQYLVREADHVGLTDVVEVEFTCWPPKWSR